MLPHEKWNIRSISFQGSIVIAFPYFPSQLTFPADNQTQQKNGMKFSVKDQEIFYDWNNAYLVYCLEVEFALRDRFPTGEVVDKKFISQ